MTDFTSYAMSTARYQMIVVGEHGPECIFPWPWDAEDTRTDWQKLQDKHTKMRQDTMAFRSRAKILLNLARLKRTVPERKNNG